MDFSVSALLLTQGSFLLQRLRSCFLDNCLLLTELLSGRWGGVRLREDGGLGSGVETMVEAYSARQVDDSVAQSGQREDRCSYLGMIFICRDKSFKTLEFWVQRFAQEPLLPSQLMSWLPMLG